MTTLQRFRAKDLLKLQNVNLDPLTENYSLSYYLHYLCLWPQYFIIARSHTGKPMGYIMGKSEGEGEEWHGHVSAVTVAPEFRRIGLAKRLMDRLEYISDTIDKAYFVDLFVRISNSVAIKMYESFGYVVYRRILNYYSYQEDAFDMRKALSKDPLRKSMIPLKHPVPVEDLTTN